jgi:tRNA 2-selenouridine synthase
MQFRVANLSQLADFDEIIDVRTPAEFAEDHIPGAINCPVLSNEERITVGTLYTQKSPFEARKVGAALVARNIAHHLETRFAGREKSWRPLVYCWRGGQRSGAMSIVLGQVGWAAHKLEGGYKTYRRDVLEQLERLPAQLEFHVICGTTGSGKSRLLAALRATGQQTLDLESLAQHRGSILGSLPGLAQPTQKWFETLLLAELKQMNAARPVYVESESNKIGSLRVPPALITAMHRGNCVLLDTPIDLRTQLLLQDYAHYPKHPAALLEQLQMLLPLHGHEKLARWQQLVASGDFNTLVTELLAQHYDPAYLRALRQHYILLPDAWHISPNSLAESAFTDLAHTLSKS